MFYQYRIDDGRFAGSGVSPIRNAEHDFTDVPPPQRDEDDDLAFWDGEQWTDQPFAGHTAPDEDDWLPKILEPLSVRLRRVARSFPAEVRAGFPFERVAYWLGQGDTDAARAVVAGVDTSGFPQEIQDGQTALLAEFGREDGR